MAEQTAACQPVYVHAYGMDRETWEKLFDRVAEAAHALDEEVSCSGGNACNLCEDPDWADLREMARNAGWTRLGSSRWAMWGVWEGEDIDDRHGWVIIHRFHRSRRFDIVGPGTGRKENRSFTELVDPTPAKLLAAARLVGLIGRPS